MNRQQILVSLAAILALTVGSDAWAQQYARPTSTLDSAAWTVTPDTSPNHHLAVDEDEQNISDTDFVDTTNGNTAPIRFGLNNVADPGADSGHSLHFRCQASNSSKGGSEYCDVALYQNSALIFQEIGIRVAARGTYTTFNVPIPDLNAAQLQVTNSNYENLEIRLTGGSIGGNDSVQYSYAALEVPEATSTPPEVTTLIALNVTDNDAQLRGQITTDGTPPVSNCGVDWGTAEGGPYDVGSQSVACSGTAPFSFTVDVTDLLTPGTDYWYIAWADNGTRTDATNEQPFTTLPAIVKPTVTVSPTVLSITTDSAFLSGNVTSDGNGTVTDCGIVWDTVQHPELSPTNTFKSLGSGTGACEGTVDGLPAGDEIFYEAYATNSAGTGYSNSDFSFLTLAGLATVTTAVEANVTATTAELGGDVTNNGGATVTDRGIVWSTTPLPQVGVDTTVQMGSGTGSFSDTVGNLVPASDVALPTGQLVYFRAYAINSEGTAYGNQRSFTPTGPPELTALPATNPLLRSVTMRGQLDNASGNTIAACGVAWGTSPTGPYPNLKAAASCTEGVPFNVSVSGLSAGTDYYYKAYATDDLAQTTLSDNTEPVTTLSEPTVQASNLRFDRVSGRAFIIKWTRGNGDGVIVVMRLAATGRTDPQDSDDYTGNPDFSHPAIPELPVNSNNFVVFKGSGTSVVVTGLTMTTDYTVAVYEYAGTGIDTNYLLTPLVEATEQTFDYAVHNLDFAIQCKECHKHGDFGARGDLMKDACLGCHVDFGLAEAKQEFDNHTTPTKNPAEDFVDCGVCHEIHNHTTHPQTGEPTLTDTTLSTNSITLQTQHNKSFLRANVDKYIETAVTPAFLHTDQPKREEGNPNDDPVQPAVTPERAVEGGNATTARGYCQVCHTMTNYHRNNAAATDPSGGERPGLMQCHDGDQNITCAPEVHCGDCHEHNNQFQGVNNNLPCEQCHDQTGQGTLPIITTQFDKLSTHIPGGSTDAVKANCVVCHDNYGHTGMFGLDADDGTKYLTGVPGHDTLATGVSETFAPHCLSCHDDGSADSLADASAPPTAGQTQFSPFTDSDAPPVIDETLWASAGHNRPVATFPSTPVSCVGGGANGCHGSGHGSDELNLLAPIPSDPDITAKASIICTECHKSGGVSSKDIRTAFRPDPNAATEALYQTTSGSGAAVNRRHDIFDADQAYSAGAVTCSACHSPHADNAGMATVLVPSDTQPRVEVGVLGYNSGDPPNPFIYGTGHDPINPVGIIPSQNLTEPDYIEFCLVCHGSDAGTSPLPGVTMSTSLINIATANAGDQHGAGTGGNSQNGYLKYPWNEAGVTDDSNPAYAALNCTTCHGAHGTGNIFNLRESITVAGVQMTVGGWVGDTIGEDPNNPGSPRVGQTTYTLPLVGRQTQKQEDHQWGAWCSFCHQMQQHSRDEDVRCTNGHMHGSTNAF